MWRYANHGRGIDSAILTDPHSSACGVVKRGSSDRLCRHSHLRRDQAGDRGGNGFPLLQADCGCEVAGSARGAAKALCGETASTMFNSSAAPISDRPVLRRWTSAIALTLATFDRCSCSGQTWTPPAYRRNPGQFVPLRRFIGPRPRRLANKGQSWPGLVLMLVDLHGSLTTLLLSPDSATTLQVIVLVSRLRPMPTTCRT